MKIYKKLFNEIISAENLFLAWDNFKRGKKNKSDILQFEQNLEENVFQLQRELVNKTYRHGAYRDFWICDPKRRCIHKATVRDRVLHHAIFRILNCVFDPTFIPTSFSCRLGRGTHQGVSVVEQMSRQVSCNHTRTAYALKCGVNPKNWCLIQTFCGMV